MDNIEIFGPFVLYVFGGWLWFTINKQVFVEKRYRRHDSAWESVRSPKHVLHTCWKLFCCPDEQSEWTDGDVFFKPASYVHVSVTATPHFL